VPDDSQRPVLVFDGDCSFCRIWVSYWRSHTGDRVEYAPYQTHAGRFPSVPVSEFQKAVQLFDGNTHYSGAEAVFHLLAFGPRGGWALWLYQLLPGFSGISEAVYRLIATHRNAGYRVTRALWGSKVEPPTYSIASSLFARAIALIYLFAFVSFGRQVRGLIGAQGIQPVTEFFAEVVRQLGPHSFWRVPTIFWWIHSEFGLESIVWGGAVIAGVAALGRPHTSGQKAAFVLLFIYYLSIVNAGQIFMSYQWDFLLLEAGFLAIFLKPAFPRVWLFRWLLFRLMFESGAVKLLSHDPLWRNLTALAVHYQTQPLPTPIAWYMMQAPLWFQKGSTAFVFVVELGLPFMMFGPRRLKQVAAFGTIGLQILIFLTGNYTFFNLLAIALCLFLLDDAFLRGMRLPGASVRVKTYANRYVSLALFAFVMILSITGLAGMFGVRVPSLIYEAISPAAPFGVVNQYGLFATMTPSRPEISIEGSNDAVDWQPYVFPYKPGPLNRAPGWAEPMQPRLDWQMWFAALGNYRENPWLLRFMMRLLQGSTPVLELIERNPFAGKPPKYIRAMEYDYRFTTFDERRQTGNWWRRELKGTYFPPISLRVSPETPALK
jgi:predicted DCC family thiol-disulfide oxidoreductase YuxK